MTRWERTLARMGMGEKSLGEELYLSVPFQMEEVEEGLRTLKIDFVFLGAEKTLGNAVYYTFQQTISTVKQVWYSLLDIVTGRFGLSQLSGPVGTASVIKEASDAGLRSLVVLVAYITINVGVFNLLPIPALDGGRALHLLVSWLWEPLTADAVSRRTGLFCALLLTAAALFLTVRCHAGLFLLLGASGTLIPQLPAINLKRAAR